MSREEFRRVGVIEVRDRPQLERLEQSLLGERELASLVLTQQVGSIEPVLSPHTVRAIAGSDSMIYFIAGDHQLRRLNETLGDALAPTRGSLQIYWPGVKAGADPFDHPAVAILDEPIASTIEELARQLDLSRPRVRQEIKQLDQLRRTAEYEKTQLAAELSSANRELEKTKRALAKAERQQAAARKTP